MEIDKFEKLKAASKNLNNIDYKYLFNLINKLGLTNLKPLTIPVGVEDIYRLIPSKNKPFTCKSQISYNPDPSLIKLFGRLNKPGQSIFYGSFATPDTQNTIITNTEEMIHILSNGNHKTKDNSIEFTIGMWKVEKPIPTIPIIFNKTYLSKNDIFKPLYNTYKKVNKTNKNLEMMTFISEEFAKTDIRSHMDYKISAAFTNLVFKAYKGKIEAIIYPSVRANGKGFNIGLTPNSVKKHLKLHRVQTFRMYFKDGYGAIDQQKVAEKINDDGSFELIPVSPNLTKGREWCLKEIDRLRKNELNK